MPFIKPCVCIWKRGAEEGGGQGVAMSITRSSGLFERRRKFHRHVIFTLLTLMKIPLGKKNPPLFWHELAIIPTFRVRTWVLVKHKRVAMI